MGSEIYSYNIPKIISKPLVGGNQDYLGWISKKDKTKELEVIRRYADYR